MTTVILLLTIAVVCILFGIIRSEDNQLSRSDLYFIASIGLFEINKIVNHGGW